MAKEVPGAALSPRSDLRAVLAIPFPFFKENPVDPALYVDGLTDFFSAFTIYHLEGIPKIKGRGSKKSANVMKELLDEWKFVGKTPQHLRRTLFILDQAYCITTALKGRSS